MQKSFSHSDNRPREANSSQLQATLNIIPAHTWYAAPSGGLTFVNTRTADYLGLPKDHPLRSGIEIGALWDAHIPLLHPDDHEETRKVWSACLRTGEAGEVRFRVRNAQGGYRWFLSRAEPLPAGNGSVLHWVGVNLDIEELKLAELALHESESKLREIIDAIPSMLWTGALETRPTHVNQNVLDYSGTRGEDVTNPGRKVMDPQMADDGSTNWMISFGPFRVAKALRLVERDGNPIHLSGRSFDILTHLLDHHGEVLSRRALLDAVWPEAAVEDVTLRVHMSKLRKALGERQFGNKYIKNVQGRGYCFSAPISRLAGPDGSGPVFAGIPVTPPNPLPRAAALIGRAEAIVELSQLILSQQIVTVVAAGGMGKTSIAIAAAHNLASFFPDGVCFVELGLIDDPSRVAHSLAVSLGLRVRSVDPLKDVVTFLQTKRMLILIDCCEHLVDSAAMLIEWIGAASSDTHILSTSREALHIEGEWVYRLEALAYPPDGTSLTAAEILSYPAPQLFSARALTSTNAIAQDNFARLIAMLCRKLDGLVLAIELAASQAHLIGIEKLVEMLDDRLSLEWSGGRAATPKHRTMNAMLDWSYQLLAGDEKEALQYLSVFSGRFDLDGATYLIASTKTFSLLTSLAAKSLLFVDQTESGLRYRLLDTTKTYARAKLTDAGELNAARHRHAKYYLTALSDLLAPTPHKLGALAAAIEDLTSAVAWAFSGDGDLSLAVDLVVGSIPVWNFLYLFQDGRHWIRKALSIVGDHGRDSQTELELQEGLALACMFISGFDGEFSDAWSRVLSLTEAEGQIDRQMVAILRLWSQQVQNSNVQKAMEFADRFERFGQVNDVSAWTGIADWYKGIIKQTIGNYSDSRIFLERAASESRPNAIATQRRLYGYDCRVSAMARLTHALLMEGDAFGAVRLLERALKEGFRENNDVSICSAQIWGTVNFILMGDLNEASRLGREFLDRAEKRALASFFSIARASVALIELSRGNDEMLEQLDLNIDLLRKQGSNYWAQFFAIERLSVILQRTRDRNIGIELAPLGIPQTCVGYWYLPEMSRLNGRLELLQGDNSTAERLFLMAIETARRQPSPFWELRAANDLAELWFADGRRDEARALLQGSSQKVSDKLETTDLARARALLNQ